VSPLFTIPNDAQSLKWYWENNAGDGTTFDLLDASGNLIRTLYGNVGTGGYWRQYAINVTPYRGQTVQLRVTDNHSDHEFRLDNFAFAVDMPDWTITDNMNATQFVGIDQSSYDGSYALHRPQWTTGGLISPVFTIPSDAQSF